MSLVRYLVRAAGDEEFGRHARETHAATFLAHVRYADIGEISEANTYPFVLDGRVFAPNGVAGELEELGWRLGEDRRNVAGETDSERAFALISRAIQRNTQCVEQLCSNRMWDVRAAHNPDDVPRPLRRGFHMRTCRLLDTVDPAGVA